MISFLLTLGALLFLTGMLALLPDRLPKLWRGDIQLPKTAPAWWSSGQVAWDGFVRAQPVGASVGATGLVVAGWCLVLDSSLEGHVLVGDPTARATIGVVAIVGVAAAIVGFGISVSVFLFNAPKAVVPPRFRHQPGAVQSWIENRRTR